MKLAKCHPQRKHKARQLCGACYEKYLKNKNPEYKKKQMSNTTRWARENPKRMRYLYLRRCRKERADPNHKIKRRDRMLKNYYGISHADYVKLLKDQNNGCALCFRQPAIDKHLHVDHDHTTGKVRGLLCHQCNWYLGTIDADPLILERIKTYRKKP